MKDIITTFLFGILAVGILYLFFDFLINFNLISTFFDIVVGILIILAIYLVGLVIKGIIVLFRKY